MSLSSRMTAFATHLADKYFKTTETDLSSYLSAGFIGTITATRRGILSADISVAVSRASGGAIGASTSNTAIASLPEGFRPRRLKVSSTRTVRDGAGYGGGIVQLATSGAISVSAHRDGDTQITAGFTYDLA